MGGNASLALHLIYALRPIYSHRMLTLLEPGFFCFLPPAGETAQASLLGGPGVDGAEPDSAAAAASPWATDGPARPLCRRSGRDLGLRARSPVVM